MIMQAGRRRKAFFLHTGWTEYRSADLRNVSPLHLHSILSDGEVAKTNIVMLHAGYPFYREAAIMAILFPNLYIDTSFVTHFRGLYKEVLRNIVEVTTYAGRSAERIVYGSDAYGIAEKIGWAAHTTRATLAAVLDELVEKCHWDEDGCMRLADMILCRNARNLLALT